MNEINRRQIVAGALALLGGNGAVAQGLRRGEPEVPFVPTPPEVVEAMLDLSEIAAGERLIDLGSGDGRIVLAAARRGALATGVEIDGDLVGRARRRARLEELDTLANFRREDLFQTFIRDADVVTLYLLTAVNLRLRSKLLAELRAGSRIVSHGFDMGDWEPDARREAADANLFLWVVPAVAGGAWRMTLPDGRAVPLNIEQRYQRVSGTLGDAPLAKASLRGARLAFTAADRRYEGRVGDRTITSDAGDWRAERA